MDALIRACVWLLEALFFAGWVGSLVVIVISGIEDMAVIFERDKPETKPNEAVEAI